MQNLKTKAAKFVLFSVACASIGAADDKKTAAPVKSAPKVAAPAAKTSTPASHGTGAAGAARPAGSGGATTSHPAAGGAIAGHAAGGATTSHPGGGATTSHSAGGATTSHPGGLPNAHTAGGAPMNGRPNTTGGRASGPAGRIYRLVIRRWQRAAALKQLSTEIIMCAPVRGPNGTTVMHSPRGRVAMAERGDHSRVFAQGRDHGYYQSRPYGYHGREFARRSYYDRSRVYGANSASADSTKGI